MSIEKKKIEMLEEIKFYEGLLKKANKKHEKACEVFGETLESVFKIGRILDSLKKDYQMLDIITR